MQIKLGLVCCGVLPNRMLNKVKRLIHIFSGRYINVIVGIVNMSSFDYHRQVNVNVDLK
ncbi:hypothetical protein T12_2482 [Trichinella patagoniensis]|uniref:Uncharacterized protein n=1 Tax=Trichinella patagoniensis TaxID=990121 RepID=A0A0V0ZDH2_9BILA|nr:hypothetical protein T12_17067 [Trichinella patagoniensis]KRY10397.1 hypothetical protein T12_2482 [Trichinella patagoniensis]